MSVMLCAHRNAHSSVVGVVNEIIINNNNNFSTVSYEVIAGYKCSSEFTFEQEKQFFVSSSFSFHSMSK